MVTFGVGIALGWGLAHMDAARWSWLGGKANAFAQWIVAKARGGKHG